MCKPCVPIQGGKMYRCHAQFILQVQFADVDGRVQENSERGKVPFGSSYVERCVVAGVRSESKLHSCTIFHDSLPHVQCIWTQQFLLNTTQCTQDVWTRHSTISYVRISHNIITLEHHNF